MVRSLGKIPWRRAWQPTPVFLPGEPHGQRSLVGYSLRGLKELGTTWWLSNQKLPGKFPFVINLSWSVYFLGAKQRNCSLRLIPLEAGRSWRQEMGHCVAFKLKCNIPLGICVLSPVWLFVTPWTTTPRLLCPWDSPGKTTGVGRHFLLQGIFPTQGIEPMSRLLRLLHWKIGCFPPSHLGSRLLHSFSDELVAEAVEHRSSSHRHRFNMESDWFSPVTSYGGAPRSVSPGAVQHRWAVRQEGVFCGPGSRVAGLLQ